MNKHKRFFHFLLTLAIVMALSFKAEAAELVSQGNIDENIVWSFYSDGSLHITGEGTINQSHTYDETPWFDFSQEVKQIVFGEGITQISIGFLISYPNVESFQVAPENPTYWTDDRGVLYSTNRTILELAPPKITGAYVIPDGVEIVNGGSFMDCYNLTSIEIPSSVTYLGDWAFAYCYALSEVKLSASLEGTFPDSFYCCSALESIEIPEGIQVIPMSAFSGCRSLTKVRLPSTLRVISLVAFSNTNISEIVIPENVETLAGRAFGGCKALKAVYFLGDKPLVFEDTAFEGASESLIIYYNADAAGWEDTTWTDLQTQPVQYTIDSEATCTKGGMQTILCPDTGLAYSREVRPLGHRYSDWNLITSAEIGKDGVWSRICKVCDYVDTKISPALLELEDKALATNNNGAQARSKINSYLESNPDGSYTRIESMSNYVLIESYDSDFQIQSRFGIPMGLPLFGGYYNDGEYRYFVFGQNNYYQNDSVEVIRVVQYTQDWNLKSEMSLCGANTISPFSYGGLRMTKQGDNLYIRTCHQMYRGYDRLSHQANFSLCLHLPDMRLLHVSAGIGNISSGYVSHSFNQFVLSEEGHLLAVDHGDAYPRSVVLIKYTLDASNNISGTVEHVEVLKFAGEIGQNNTGASVGGFAISDDCYLIAGNSTPQNEASDILQGKRNVFLTVTSKEDFSKSGTTLHWLTNFGEDSDIEASTPHLVKISSNKLCILWTEGEKLRYVFVDGTGNPVSQIYEAKGALSDCVPIVTGNKLIWYVTNQTAPIFYEIDLSDPSIVARYISETAFVDVHLDDYFYKPVKWAVSKYITNGTDETHFSPHDQCTRGQVVTFLWRANGCPTPTKTDCTFTDVEKGSWYYNAMLWAVEKGITNGTGNGSTFSPTKECSRAEVATFLHRANGSPAPIEASHSFTDVEDGSWYYNAMLWAVEKGITNGTGSGTTFSPTKECSRAEVVTFLYRTMK